jgi:molybdate transport system regulatory protein
MKPPNPSQKVILVRPRVYIGDAISIGPGKIDLLRGIGEMHSISAAARALGIPYKRAWLLVDSLNQGFGQAVVETATGGRGGGGTQLTPLGKRVLTCYEALEARIKDSAQAELDQVRRLVE